MRADVEGVVSAPVRDTQLSLVDGMERPVGPLPLSVQTGNNADLIAKMAPLYLTGSVLDVTYGKGKWWDRFTPEPFTYHDLHTVDGIDFRDLPHDDDSFDAVCFDPPYIISGSPSTDRLCAEFQDRFGIGTQNLAAARNTASGEVRFQVLLAAGLAECVRVARRYVLVKCMEFAQGNHAKTDFHDIPFLMTKWALDLGCVKHDQIVHNAGTGPGGHNITTIKRARRAHSYLLVFVPAKTSDSPLLDGSDAGTVGRGDPHTAVPATSAGGLGPAPSGAALPAATPAGSPSTHEEATAPAAHGPVA